MLAPNPGPMTLEGTNTWVLHAPGASAALVVDPGPDDDTHLDAVLRTVRERGAAAVGAVLLTHGHADHSAGARRLAEAAGCGVRALDPRHRLGSEGLSPGDVVAAGDLEVVVTATPGHTGDSLSFLLPARTALLTGDTVLGRGTAVIAAPDGRLDDYLASLHALLALAGQGRVTLLLPGHGPPVADAATTLAGYLAHRARRLDEVAAALAAGAATPGEVVDVVYAGLDPALRGAAERSVAAQLEYLRAR